MGARGDRYTDIDQNIAANLRTYREAAAISQEELLLLEEVAANLSFALQYLERQDAVRYLSYFDPITDLANRTLFCERVARLIGQDSAGVVAPGINGFTVRVPKSPFPAPPARRRIPIRRGAIGPSRR